MKVYQKFLQDELLVPYTSIKLHCHILQTSKHTTIVVVISFNHIKEQENNEIAH